ncbi:divalent-cation tolerance protein CutA [Cucumibacter marinus]|uniref:divalent-cation tolerance protein CutA n=1 Tax=Cucumibacter marinus TaxID=1121252 RepID=UPI000421F40A|nr:divalent-cation tolerance protein CutA [Cucumibacter marinus]
MQTNPDALLVTISIDTLANARRLADALVSERVAACVQILPATSVYRWQGAIEAAEELILTAKTRSGLLESLERVVADHHTYDVPEIVATPVVAINRDYADWLASSLEGPAAAD